MAHSRLMQKIHDEQRAEMQRLTPAERLVMALELSDLCATLHTAGLKALEERHVTGKTEADN